MADPAARQTPGPSSRFDRGRYNSEGYRPWDMRKRITGSPPPPRGGLDAYNALQNRSLRAFQPNQYEDTSVMSAPAVGEMAREKGVSVTPAGVTPAQGMLTPAVAPSIPPSVRYSPTPGGYPAFNPMTGGNEPIPGGWPAPPAVAPPPSATPRAMGLNTDGAGAPGTGIPPFVERLRNAGDAVAMRQREQAQNPAPPPMVPGGSYSTKYGTASSTIVPRGTPSNFQTNRSSIPATGPEFFQSAANRQGVANKFATPQTAATKNPEAWRRSLSKV